MNEKEYIRSLAGKPESVRYFVKAVREVISEGDWIW